MPPPTTNKGTGSAEWLLSLQGVEWSAVTAIIKSFKSILGKRLPKKKLIYCLNGLFLLSAISVVGRFVRAFDMDVKAVKIPDFPDRGL